MACAAILCSCDGKNSGNSGNGGSEQGGGESEKVSDIVVVDGKVTFKLAFAKETPHSACGLSSNGTKVIVGGKEYKIEKDDKGNKIVVVDENPGGSYNAVLINNASAYFYGSSASTNVQVPYSQFYGTTAQQLKDYPMYAAYSKETGDVLQFRDGFALLDIVLKGSAKITSIKVQDPTGSTVGGFANYMPSKKRLVATSGVDFSVLNCTVGSGSTALSADGTHFPVMVMPGTFPKGLDVTVTTLDHRVMRFNLLVGTLEGNDVYSETMDFVPDANIAFYEGFDNMVWGGNYVGGENSAAYAPSSEKMAITGGTGYTGYEEASTPVSCDSPAAGYIQPDNWNDVTGNTVLTCHQMTESYIRSRALEDYKYCFRCQEYQGCIAIGAAAGTRGIFQACCMKAIEGIRTVKVNFDFCVKAGFNDSVLAQIMNGGYITSVKIDGRPLSFSADCHYYKSASSSVIIKGNQIIIPSSATGAKKWQHCEMTVERATSGSTFYLAANASTNGNHGIFLDNFEVVPGAEMERGDLRVLYWNIQNGMWADQANGYANFVKWVKKFDPDICVWCEAESIYYDNSNQSSGSMKYLPDGWAALAPKYGHKYVACGGNRDNYPQEITSKYPITTLLRITDGENPAKPVAHGAGLHQVTVNGVTINFITMHTWPQGYGYGVAAAQQEASKAAREGDYYREYEMKCVLAQTKNNPKYSAAKDWLLMGDMNSRTRLDAAAYSYAADDPIYLCQDQVLKTTDFVDIIHEKYPNDFMSSTYGNARIDFMYASPSMYARVKNAMILIDDWTCSVPSRYVTSFYDPSDHRPVLVDYKF